MHYKQGLPFSEIINIHSSGGYVGLWGLSLHTIPHKCDWLKLCLITKTWLEVQLERDTESSCLHLALQAASFAPMASLQHLNTCSDRQIDTFPSACKVLCVLLCLLKSSCVCTRALASDLGSGPGTWPRCVPVSDRRPPSPGRGCRRNDHLRHTLGWSWCGYSRCCKRT